MSAETITSSTAVLERTAVFFMPKPCFLHIFSDRLKMNPIAGKLISNLRKFADRTAYASFILGGKCHGIQAGGTTGKCSSFSNEKDLRHV
ncbi:MAG: hypothetical protein PHW61_06600, partial [Eubacteriales bacterium]|nr:hypothetical protein [Eubacteriales bacterium]